MQNECQGLGHLKVLGMKDRFSSKADKAMKAEMMLTHSEDGKAILSYGPGKDHFCLDLLCYP